MDVNIVPKWVIITLWLFPTFGFMQQRNLQITFLPHYSFEINVVSLLYLRQSSLWLMCSFIPYVQLIPSTSSFTVRSHSTGTYTIISNTSTHTSPQADNSHPYISFTQSVKRSQIQFTHFSNWTHDNFWMFFILMAFNLHRIRFHPLNSLTKWTLTTFILHFHKHSIFAPWQIIKENCPITGFCRKNVWNLKGWTA